MERAEEIRALLREFIEYETAEELREELRDISKATYTKKHTDKEYMEFIENNNIAVDTVHPQDENYPYYLCMFSEKSQHVYGDSIYECLDKAM